MDSWSCKHCGRAYVVDDFTPPSVPGYLLDTNYAPIESEWASLRETICSATFQGMEQDLLTMDKSIASLQNTLEALNKRRSKVEKHLRAFKGMMSPIRRLPAEIIGQIMTRALDTCEKVTADTSSGIWTYSHVCKLWRSVALSTPSFWSKISITVDAQFSLRESLRRTFMPKEECIQTIISRSGNHLLSFTYEHCVDCLLSPEVSQPLLKIFMEVAPRWREASFCIPSALFPALSKAKTRVPNLQSLSLYATDSDWQHADCWRLRSYFRQAPALRRVAFGLLENPEILKLPWDQITSYTNIGLVPMDLDHLNLMPNIVSLNLIHCEPTECYISELRYLRSLGASAISCFAISSLTLPVLEHVTMSDEVELLVEMRHLVERSNCLITLLELTTDFTSDSDSIPAGTETWVNFFKVIPRLSILDLRQLAHQKIPSIFQVLTHNSNLLPVLTELILPRFIITDSTILSAVHLFLQNRQNLVSSSPQCRPIESIFFCGRARNAPLAPELQLLQSIGAHISFGEITSLNDDL